MVEWGMTQKEQSSLFPHLDPEDSRLELKSCKNGALPDDIWKVISAFANTEGGRLILGVNPDNKPVGLTSHEIDLLERNILAACQNTFNYPILPDIQVLGSVVVASIPPAPAAVRPVYSSKRGITIGAYVRVGASNVIVSDEMRNQFAVAARGGAELIEYTDRLYTDCLDNSLIEQYIELINARRNNVYKNLSPREVLIKLKAITQSDTVTLFGLLAFGKDENLQEVSAPTTNIAVTHYPSDTKVLENDPLRTHLDNREFNGNVIDQFIQAFAFVKSKLPISGSVDPNGQRRDYLVIPEVALREALANEIAHRDYSTHSSRIQIDIYSDRLEIINPGTSLVPIEDLESAPSVSRNPLVMSFLKDYGYTEQRARGIRTIRQSLRSAGLLEPEFSNIGTSFKAVLYSSAFISRSDQAWLTQFQRLQLNERQLTGLTHLKNAAAGLNNSEYCAINNMSNVGDDRRARNDLTKLVNYGLVRISGQNKSRRYYISEAFAGK
jgi:ATP-dependent DNA helicase RecG